MNVKASINVFELMVRVDLNILFTSCFDKESSFLEFDNTEITSSTFKQFFL